MAMDGFGLGHLKEFAIINQIMIVSEQLNLKIKILKY